jgi:hypothetical protein
MDKVPCTSDLQQFADLSLYAEAEEFAGSMKWDYDAIPRQLRRGFQARETCATNRR